MLQTKPQGHWPVGSGEEDFWSVFNIYGRGGHLCHVSQTLRLNIRSPIPLRLHMKFGLWLAQRFWRRRSLKMVDGRTDDGVWLYYKPTNEPKGSGELIKKDKY